MSRINTSLRVGHDFNPQIVDLLIFNPSQLWGILKLRQINENIETISYLNWGKVLTYTAKRKKMDQNTIGGSRFYSNRSKDEYI